jgi:hypothetical protein
MSKDVIPLIPGQGRQGFCPPFTDRSIAAEQLAAIESVNVVGSVVPSSSEPADFVSKESTYWAFAGIDTFNSPRVLFGDSFLPISIAGPKLKTKHKLYFYVESDYQVSVKITVKFVGTLQDIVLSATNSALTTQGFAGTNTSSFIASLNPSMANMIRFAPLYPNANEPLLVYLSPYYIDALISRIDFEFQAVYAADGRAHIVITGQVPLVADIKNIGFPAPDGTYNWFHYFIGLSSNP